MTDHEETARQILPCKCGYEPDAFDTVVPAIAFSEHQTWCQANRRPAVAAALAQAEAKGVRMGLERARMILASRVFADGEKSCNCDVEMRDRLDAEIAKAGGKRPA